MNTCDISELRHQLLQEFYKLAEKPEEWEYIQTLVSRWKNGTFEIRQFMTDYYLSVNNVEVHDEEIGSYESVLEKEGSFFRRPKYHTKFIVSQSPFVVACRKLAEYTRDKQRQLREERECKALEEALANVNKPKAKAPRKAKTPKSHQKAGDEKTSNQAGVKG